MASTQPEGVLRQSKQSETKPETPKACILRRFEAASIMIALCTGVVAAYPKALAQSFATEQYSHSEAAQHHLPNHGLGLPTSIDASAIFRKYVTRNLVSHSEPFRASEPWPAIASCGDLRAASVSLQTMEKAINDRRIALVRTKVELFQAESALERQREAVKRRPLLNSYVKAQESEVAELRGKVDDLQSALERFQQLAVRRSGACDFDSAPVNTATCNANRVVRGEASSTVCQN